MSSETAKAIACELCIATLSGTEDHACAAGWTHSWDGWLCPAHGTDQGQATSPAARELLADGYGSHSFKRLNALAERIRANDQGLGDEVKIALHAIDRALAVSARPLLEQAKALGYTLIARRDATDEEIADWTERHDLGHAVRGTDARAAFEDAQTLCLISPATPVTDRG